MSVLYLRETALPSEVSWQPISSPIRVTVYSNVVLDTRKLSNHSLSVNAVSTTWSQRSVRANVHWTSSLYRIASQHGRNNKQFVSPYSVLASEKIKERSSVPNFWRKVWVLFTRRNSRYFGAYVQRKNCVLWLRCWAFYPNQNVTIWAA